MQIKIRAISRFWVKTIFPHDVFTLDRWFADGQEICSYLTDQGNERMRYSAVNPQAVDAVRRYKDAKAMQGCIMGHVFVYTPNSSHVWIIDCRCVKKKFFRAEEFS